MFITLGARGARMVCRKFKHAGTSSWPERPRRHPWHGESVTPRDRYYVDLRDFHQIRIITIIGRPPSIMCTSQHTRYAGGIVMIITIVHDGTHKNNIYSTTTHQVKSTKDTLQRSNNNGSKIVSDYGQDTNWTKGPEDK